MLLQVLDSPLYTMSWGSLTSFNIKAKVEAVFLSVLLEMPNFADPNIPAVLTVGLWDSGTPRLHHRHGPSPGDG